MLMTAQFSFSNAFLNSISSQVRIYLAHFLKMIRLLSFLAAGKCLNWSIRLIFILGRLYPVCSNRIHQSPAKMGTDGPSSEVVAEGMSSGSLYTQSCTVWRWIWGFPFVVQCRASIAIITYLSLLSYSLYSTRQHVLQLTRVFQRLGSFIPLWKEKNVNPLQIFSLSHF